jgi:hypothetical protein
MYGGERTVASKQEYAQLLPDRMKRNPTIKLHAPKIRLGGDNAKVQVNAIIRGTTVAWTMHAVRENGRWYLMGWEY